MAARSENGTWVVPCAKIEDRPKLKWRILSDDVSRGPLPTMRYFLERIRTIAAFKMNGYSPYMENTFVDPANHCLRHSTVLRRRSCANSLSSPLGITLR